MKLLLDTHAFIWLHSAPHKLSLPVKNALLNPKNTLWLSVVTAWEMQIKIQIGKMTLTSPLADMIDKQQKTNYVQMLPVNLQHVLWLHHLLLHHKDPFDRLLIAQANVEKAVLVSKDAIMAKYHVQTLW